jgi:hypothetical protein
VSVFFESLNSKQSTQIKLHWLSRRLFAILELIFVCQSAKKRIEGSLILSLLALVPDNVQLLHLHGSRYR